MGIETFVRLKKAFSHTEDIEPLCNIVILREQIPFPQLLRDI